MDKTSPPILFSSSRKAANDARAMRIADKNADFLAKEAATNLADRLAVTNRQFELAVDVFSAQNSIAPLLEASDKTGQVTRLVSEIDVTNLSGAISTKSVMADREVLPLHKNSVNLVTSVFGLHWCNDLPGMFAQIRNVLIPDGLFLACLPGERTLQELRDCLLLAETELSGNVSLRVDPFGEIRQLGGLLQRAGFSLPVVDSDVLTVRYSSMYGLIEDLRAMGATSALSKRPGFGPRNLFEVADRIYNEKYSDVDGRIRATFEIVYLTGWSPHESQQQPLKPGSADLKMSDFLGKN